jgi:NodT family efflux transporter outer membrane factor (OMF) lipoprotein
MNLLAKFNIGLLASVLFLAGCMVGPKYKNPGAPGTPAYKEQPPASYKEDKNWKQAQPNDGVLRGKWWEMYNDPVLNALEEQVSISNQNVLMYEAKYFQARDAVKIARAALFPTVSTTPAITKSRSGGQNSSNANTQTSSFSRSGTSYDLPFSLSYTVDIWGSIRRTVNSNVALAQASAAQLETARLSYQSELAQDYFSLHGVDGDQDLLERTVKDYEQYLDLTKARFDAGIASDSDVAQAEAQLEGARASLIELGTARAQFEHAIAVLTGKPPASLAIARAVLTTPPPPVPVGVPSTLLERRPDIAEFERQMAAANEQIGIATAAFYPTVTLGASAGLSSSSFTNWFTWPSRFWSVGPQLAETLFDAGKRRATVAEAQHAYDATVANYRQTVLTAFQQVEDSLVALRVLEDEAAAEDRAVKAAERSLSVATEQYKAGTADYLQVLTAQNVAYGDQRAAIDILTRRMTSSVLLIEALGGGWNVSTLPARDQITSGK